MKTAYLPALVLGVALCARTVDAQNLIHRYSFNGNANDSVGSANGTIVGGVTIASSPYVNGSALFPGGTTTSNPSYVSLPVSAVSNLQNATVEIFTTNFNTPNKNNGTSGGQFQALFAVATAAPDLTNYVLLSPNRNGSGIGTGSRTNNVNPDQVIVSNIPLPDGVQNHIVDLVYSGFTGVGSTGTETIYVDGAQVAQGNTVYSFADVAQGPGGIATVGIGGGSPYNDPTYFGSIDEVRIFDGALSSAQIQTDVDAGPAYLGFPWASVFSVQSNLLSATGPTTLTGTVTLTGAAPAGGQQVALTSNQSAVSVPPSVIVPQGQTTATFSIALAKVYADTSAIITASYGGGQKTVTVKDKASVASASFVGVDVSTQGNWRDKYGVSGFNVIGDTSTGNPHYSSDISVTPGTHNTGLWTASSLSPACLQLAASGSPNRLAGIWFQTSWTMNVNFASTHALELYLLDYPNAGYAETITFKDANTGAVLSTQAASGFAGGKYYIWNVTGNVNVTFTSTAGHWAVLSGIFVGGATGSKSPTKPTNFVATQTASGIGLTWTASTGATSYNVYRGTTAGGESTTPIATGIKTTSYTNTGLTPTTYYYKVVAVNSYAGSFASTEASATAPTPTSTATFVKTDTAIQGNWKGHYGVDGYNIIGDTSGPNPVYPAYATVTPGTHTSGIWAATSTSASCLQKVAAASTDHMAGVWYQTSWSMNVNVTGTHQLALYILDFPNAGYAETITIKDATTGTVLDTRSASSFTGGIYEVWNVSGNVTVTLTSTAGHWAVVSGIFFG